MADVGKGADAGGKLSPRRGRKNTKGKKGTPHDISPEASDGEDERQHNGSGGFSEAQMKEFATLMSTAMGTALASVSQIQLPPKSVEAESESKQDESSEEEGELDEVDTYDKEIEMLVGSQETKGPEISEKVSRLLEKCLGTALDEKAVKEKRELYPRPANVKNVVVPRLNQAIYSRCSKEHQFSDRALQGVQSFLVAGMSAVASQAEQALNMRSWYNSLKEEEKESLPLELAKMGKMYVTLMDATMLFTRTMGDLTSLRRKILKNELVEPYKSLLDDDKNPASPSWLAGDDVHGAIEKAKQNALLADKITAKTSWPGPYKKKRYHPYDRKDGGNRRDSDYKGSDKQQRGGNRGKGRGGQQRRDNSRSYSRGDDRRDFWRRDSR